ncbi:MAG: DegV family protein [Clostridia bacterium]|nr:DegV family protein [Clostridia bacterium]
MIKIMVDSTAYTPKDYAEKHDIKVIPLRVLYKQTEFEEGYPGTFDAFFEDFLKTKIFPKTSQPSLETFIEEYNKAIDNGDEVIMMTISSTLSGTNSVANLAKEQCKSPEKVHVFDTMSEVQTMLGYVMEAVEMRDKNATCEEILAHLQKLTENSFVTFIPDTLEYLAKGGRIGKVTATIGNLLQIKPIIIFKKGVLSDKKSFGMQKAIKDMISLIPEKIKRLFLIHVANSKSFEIMKKMVFDWLEKKGNKNKVEIHEGEVGPVTACHVGPAVGLAWTCE